MHLFSLLIPVFCCSKDSYGHQSCLPVVDHFWGPYRAGGCLRKQEDEPLARQAVGRRWVFLCCIDDNRTLLKLYFLTEWDHIHQNELQFIRCLLPNMNKQTNKQTMFFLFSFTECDTDNGDICLPYNNQCPNEFYPCLEKTCGDPDVRCCCMFEVWILSREFFLSFVNLSIFFFFF